MGLIERIGKSSTGTIRYIPFPLSTFMRAPDHYVQDVRSQFLDDIDPPIPPDELLGIIKAYEDRLALFGIIEADKFRKLK